MLTLAATDFLSASAGTAGVITFSAFGDTIVTGADTFSLIAQSTLSNTVATVVPTNSSPRLLKTLTFVNTSASVVSDIRLFANGTAGSNRIISFALPANGSAKFDANGLSVYDASGSLLTFGLNGRGISTIVRTGGTGAVGTTDTYTITYSDNTTSTFTVTNGSSVIVGTTTVVTPVTNPSVTDADAGGNVDLRFNLPRARNVQAGTTTTGAPGTNASVSGAQDANGDVTFNFTIPRGDVGQTGATGQAAFTATTANFTQPASAATVSVSVLSTAWMSTGQYLFIETGGYYQVSSITNATTVVLTNLGYPENATAGSTIASGSKVSSAGVRGATGANGQSVAVADEGNQLTPAATSINFTGAGVTATNTGSVVTVTIDGGNSFASVTGNSGTATADSPGDTIAITGGTGISTAATDTPDGLVITNTDTGSSAVATHEALADPHTQYSRLDSIFFNAADYGTLVDGSDAATVSAAQATANTSAIQAAINAASSSVGKKPGGIVIIPPGTYHINATLSINTSCVRLVGSGARSTSDVGSQTGAGTTLFWNNTASPATTAMIEVVSTAGPTNPAVKGAGCGLMNLQAAGNVGIGLLVRSIHYGLFHDLYVINATAAGLKTECLVTGTTLGEAADVTKCTFDNIRVRMLEAPNTSVGLLLTGAANANTSNSTFRNIAVSCQQSQIAVDIQNTDSNRFYDVVVNQSNGGTVQPVVLRGGASEALASRGNMFFGLATGGSSTGIRGLKSEGTDTVGVVAPAMNNRIWGYSIENGEPAPLVGTGSVLQYQLVGGAATLSRTAVIANATTTTETIIARWLLPENFFYPRNDLIVEARGQVSGTATLIYRVRVGTAGTTADPIAAQFTTSAAGVANAHTGVRANVECLTAGATGTITASGFANLASAILSNATAAFTAATANTSARLFVSVSVQQSAAQTYTTRVAKIIRED